MTAETTTVSLDAVDAALAAATPRLSEDEQRLAAALLRLLSAGAPVTIAAAAIAAGMPRARAEPVVRSWPAVFWDDRGQWQQEAPEVGLAVAGFRDDDQPLTFPYGGRSTVWCRGYERGGQLRCGSRS